ncbi:MAG: cysteine-rich small domain-containing protein [Oscillospiraceae bacterium]|nr:cysteine-rich small domain-containing protein [Oscillospiraceae bacterium]
MANYDFFQNKACEYFPCHQGADPEKFSCLFCYCPLYCLGENCGGNFVYLPSGIKDCSGCLRPHKRECYESIMAQMGQVMELAKKP